MCMTELGHYSINVKERRDVFKHYCPIMPNTIEDLFFPTTQMAPWVLSTPR